MRLERTDLRPTDGSGLSTYWSPYVGEVQVHLNHPNHVRSSTNPERFRSFIGGVARISLLRKKKAPKDLETAQALFAEPDRLAEVEKIKQNALTYAIFLGRHSGDWGLAPHGPIDIACSYSLDLSEVIVTWRVPVEKGYGLPLPKPTDDYLERGWKPATLNMAEGGKVAWWWDGGTLMSGRCIVYAATLAAMKRFLRDAGRTNVLGFWRLNRDNPQYNRHLIDGKDGALARLIDRRNFPKNRPFYIELDMGADLEAVWLMPEGMPWSSVLSRLRRGPVAHKVTPRKRSSRSTSRSGKAA